MTSVKVSYGTEIRRISLAKEARGLSSFAEFVSTVKGLFPQLSNKKISLIWHDEDGDKVTVSSEPEFAEALRLMDSAHLLRFELVSVTEGFSSTGCGTSVNVFVHRGITCDECGVNPIRGFRYKCTVRDDFDLCESCEGKRVQPFPMVKIGDPREAPAAMIYAFHEHDQQQQQPQRGSGCPWRRGGCRRFNNNNNNNNCNNVSPDASNATAGSATTPAASAPAAEEQVPRWKARWERRSERCGRRFAESVAPFVTAFDKFVQDPTASAAEGSSKVAQALSDAVQGVMSAMGVEDESAAAAASANAGSGAPQTTLEDQMLQEAIQESLLLNEVATAFANVPTANHNNNNSATVSTASASAAPAPAPAPDPAATVLPKPALRFIRDVTYPDGAVVQPGATFRKMWRVRNDGAHAWPADASLAPAGGDVMQQQDNGITEVLPVVAAGEEQEIGISLTAPERPGLYTAYFRAQTKEKQSFGHRLWATVMVAEPSFTAPSTAARPVVVGDVAVASAIATSPTTASEQDWTNVEVASVSSTDSDNNTPVASHISTASSLASSAPPSAPASTVSAVAGGAASPAVQPLHLLWRKELTILNDMGFFDYDANVPLLQQHLKSPVSLQGNRDAVPNGEGMQRVIAALLGM